MIQFSIENWLLKIENSMNFFQKIKPEWPLRIALGAMYLYSGIDLVRHPTAWHWALPYWMREIITSVLSLDTYLVGQGIVELAFAVVLLAWFLPRGAVWVVTVASVFEFAAILILAFVPFSEVNFSITFRDIGLLGASIALFLLVYPQAISRSSDMPPLE